MFQKLRNCKLCSQDFTVFHRNSCASVCPSCKPEHTRAKARKYYNRYIETGVIDGYRKAMRKRQVERHKDDAVRLVARAKNRARMKNVECTIKPEDLVIPEVCPVFGTPFVKSTEYAMSIDAIDPSKGYTPDNVQVISMKANAMKNSASQQELLQFANWVLVEVGRVPDVLEIT